MNCAGKLKFSPNTKHISLRASWLVDDQWDLTCKMLFSNFASYVHMVADLSPSILWTKFGQDI
jgi:hypothetical protein